MSEKSRRQLLKSIAAGSCANIAGKNLHESWSRPVVDSVLLPAHASTSPDTTGCSTVIVSCHTEGIYNGTYTMVDEWNGKPHYTNGTTHLYYYDANDGGERGWSLDNRDQSAETPPGGTDWYDGGWFDVDGAGYSGYCPPTGLLEWNDYGPDNLCIVLPSQSCNCR